MLIAQGAIDASKIGVAIAIRYGANRPQFGDTAIMQYVTHQRRLLPALATTYALHLSMIRCKNLALVGSGNNGSSSSSGLSAMEAAKQVHVLSSGLKAAATWHRTAILQDCRECCGGLGVMSANRIGPMLNDMNVDVTFEGDNTVMMQQVAKPLVEAALSLRNISAPVAPRINPLDLGPGCVRLLLNWRVQSITAEVAGTVAAAATKSGNSAKAAGATALEASMDRLVALGWAAVDSSSYKTFVEEIKNAPYAWRNTLSMLSLLYGLSRVEKGLSCYLAGGALPAAAVGPLRLKINSMCADIVGNDGAKSAVALCDAWGIPDHLLHAPIALRDWRGI